MLCARLIHRIRLAVCTTRLVIRPPRPPLLVLSASRTKVGRILAATRWNLSSFVTFRARLFDLVCRHAATRISTAVRPASLAPKGLACLVALNAFRMSAATTFVVTR
eukprot:365477-Chlamydomonas_euryale.AAC.13